MSRWAAMLLAVPKLLRIRRDSCRARWSVLALLAVFLVTAGAAHICATVTGLGTLAGSAHCDECPEGDHHQSGMQCSDASLCAFASAPMADSALPQFHPSADTVTYVPWQSFADLSVFLLPLDPPPIRA